MLARLKPLERRFFGSRSPRNIVAIVDRASVSIAVLESELVSSGCAIRGVAIEEAEKRGEDEITLLVDPFPQEDQLLQLLSRIRHVKGVKSVEARRR